MHETGQKNGAGDECGEEEGKQEDAREEECLFCFFFSRILLISSFLSFLLSSNSIPNPRAPSFSFFLVQQKRWKLLHA